MIADFALQRGALRSRTLLLDTDAHVAEGSGGLDFGREQIDLLSFDLLALQQPVATDLRVALGAGVEVAGKDDPLRPRRGECPPQCRDTARETNTA